MAALLGALLASGLCGQTFDAAGLILGGVRSRQLWSPSADTRSRDGIAIGAWVGVRPHPVVGVRAEATYSQRGSQIPTGEGAGTTGVAPVRADRLAMPVLLELRVARGTSAAYLLLGPAFELLLETRVDPNLRSLYDEPAGTVFSGVLGAGVEATLRGYRTALEARFWQGVSPAYRGTIEIHERSAEVLLRIGVLGR